MAGKQRVKVNLGTRKILASTLHASAWELHGLTLAYEPMPRRNGLPVRRCLK